MAKNNKNLKNKKQKKPTPKSLKIAGAYGIYGLSAAQAESDNLIFKLACAHAITSIADGAVDSTMDLDRVTTKFISTETRTNNDAAEALDFVAGVAELERLRAGGAEYLLAYEIDAATEAEAEAFLARLNSTNSEEVAAAVFCYGEMFSSISRSKTDQEIKEELESNIRLHADGILTRCRAWQMPSNRLVRLVLNGSAAHEQLLKRDDD